MSLHPLWIVAAFTVADWSADSNQELANFGWDLSSAGDVNGDGYADVIAGVPYYDNGETSEGRAYVYLGSGDGLSTTAGWIAESNMAGSYFGGSVAGGGDVNGDGFDDVIVTASSYWNELTAEGRASVFHGSAAGLEPTAAWTAEGDQTLAYFGSSSAFAGDVNGDGFADIVVGASAYDNGEFDEGRVSAYYGSAAGLSTVAAWTAESDQVSAKFGSSVASAGDVNGDGFDDVIVGASLYEHDLIDEGGAFVFLGSEVGLSEEPDWAAESNQAESLFGSSVSSAGDVDGDGYDEVLVGAPWIDNPETSEGRVFLYYGSATGPETVAGWGTEPNEEYAFSGTSAESAGDVNADGFADVIVGCQSCDGDLLSAAGKAFVFFGSPSGLASVADLILQSGQGGSLFGVEVAGAGDVNGDGSDDVLVGAPFYDNGETQLHEGEIYEGRAYLFEGLCTDPVDSDGDTVGDRCDRCPDFDDRLDVDLDGVVDDCDACPAVYDPTQQDDDADGLGNACDPCPENPSDTGDADADGFCTPLDCDDTNPRVHPGASEECDGVDNACVGSIAPDELDEDGDGVLVCAGDCDDADPDLFYGQTELCNGFDDNCDGGIDTNCDAQDGDGPDAQGCGCNGVGGAAGAPLVSLVVAMWITRRRR